MKKCAFCPVESVKLTGEHIWDDWLNRELPTKDYRVRHKPSISSDDLQWQANRLKLKAPVACAACNNEWMSRLTESVKAGFRDAILHGAELSILRSGSAVLAAYVFLKAAAIDYAYPDSDGPFFSRAVRESLRKSLAIPPMTQIWLCAFQGKARYSGRCFLGHVEAVDKGPSAGLQWFTFTYVVGHLVLQLLVPRWKDIRYRGRALPLLKPDPYWDQAAIRIWPITSNYVSWPPPKYFGDDMIGSFIDRFKLPIRMRVA